jgi:hypothetical protein
MGRRNGEFARDIAYWMVLGQGEAIEEEREYENPAFAQAPA